MRYEQVLINLTSYAYVNIVQKIVNKRVDINVNSKNEEILLHLTCGNNCDGVILILFIRLNLLFLTTFFFSGLRNYEFVQICKIFVIM